MFGFGSNKTSQESNTQKPVINPYARESYKRDKEDELGTDYTQQKAIASSFGNTDLDYVLAHYAPEMMKQLDRIEATVENINNTINEALKERGWEGKYVELDVQYTNLYNKHNLLLKYLADEHLQKKFAYKDETQEQKTEDDS